MRLSILFLYAFVAGVLAIPARSGYVVHERRDVIPSHWTKEKRLDGQVVLPMRIGLAQSNLDRGNGLLMEVYVLTPLSYLPLLITQI
jgi:tripeptidyl-peptidase-1